MPTDARLGYFRFVAVISDRQERVNSGIVAENQPGAASGQEQPVTSFDLVPE